MKDCVCFLDKKLLYDAAKGHTEALASWIEINQSLRGIPYQLIAELVRNSKGCMKNVSVERGYNIEYDKLVDEQGNVELYTSRREAECFYVFLGQAKPRGRPNSLIITKRDRKILKDYEALQYNGVRSELAYEALSNKYHLAIETVIRVIKTQRADGKWIKEAFQRVGVDIKHKSVTTKPEK